MPSADVEWVFAGKEHRSALQRFVCATPARGTYDPHRGHFHPQQWALDVQSWMRGRIPPLGDGEGLLLGLVDGEVAVACHFGFDNSWEQFQIWAVGTSVNRQRQGLAHAALEISIDVLEQNRARLGLDCGVFTRIHQQNANSKALFAARGFIYLETVGDYENWVSELH